MTAQERIAALEAEVAELKRYVPMLARMAFYEQYTRQSIVEHIEIQGEVFAAVGSIFCDHSPMAGSGRCVPIEIGLDRPDVFMWDDDEPLPSAAHALACVVDPLEARA